MKTNYNLQASFDTIRVGKQYYLKNYGETTEFKVIEIMPDADYRVCSLDTLETFMLSDLVKYGVSEDFLFKEL